MMRKYIKIIFDYIKLYWMIWKNELHLTLNGGLGDVILDSYFINIIKKKHPKCKIIVYYRDNNSEANPNNFSWGSTRKYKTNTGKCINPIYEFLSEIEEINNLIGTNIDSFTYGIRVYPEYFRKYFGYPEPIKINMYLKNILDKNNSNNINETINAMNNFDINISLHLRRNSEKILELAYLIDKNFKNVNFILLGSSEHQKIPKINLNNSISLIDSYSQNKNLFDVLTISSRCDLFIGGRGGFEVFHWLIQIPSICFFDKMGYDELKRGWWDDTLWVQNKIDKLYSDNSIVKEVFTDEIKNILFNK